MKQIDKQIQSIRPSLRQVSPLTFWISVGFTAVNIALAFILMSTYAAGVKIAPMPIVNNFLTFQVWGAWMLFLAIGMAVSLAKNNWHHTRVMMIAGFITKLLWAYALAYLVFNGYNLWATLVLWSFLAWVQGWTIVYFMPVSGNADSGGEEL